jgi:hypothetical protein
MTQALYAHMNNKTIKKKRTVFALKRLYFFGAQYVKDFKNWCFSTVYNSANEPLICK